MMRGGTLIEFTKFTIFDGCLSNLKETSLDNRNIGNTFYMTNSKRKAIDFDMVKEKYMKPLCLTEIPKSNDALFITQNGRIVFIEFKNGRINSATKYEIWNKIYDSVIILTDILNIRISELKEELDYILVYNEAANSKNPEIQQKNDILNSSSFTELLNKISDYAKEEHICFGVRKFKNYFFRNVHTFSQYEFEKYLRDN